MNTFISACLVAFVAVSTDARPQIDVSNIFGRPSRPSNGGFDINRPDHLVVAGGTGLAGLFAIKNIAEGDDQISLSPTLGAAYNPDSGQIVPQLGVAAKVGSGELAPTFNVGGQFDGRNINPYVGSGIGVGNGPLGGNANTGVVFGQNGPQTTFGGSAAVGNFNLGSALGGKGFNFGRRR